MSTVVSKLKDFSRSQAVEHTIKFAIPEKRWKIRTLSSQQEVIRDISNLAMSDSLE